MAVVRRHRSRRKASYAAVTLALVATLVAGCSSSQAGGGGSKFPQRDLTLIAASDPGGGLDLASRAVDEALEAHKLLDVGLSVVDVGGGGGNPARAALLSRPNDGTSVVAETNRVFLNPLTGTTDLKSDRFTPIAKLMTEYLVWAVPINSPYKDAGAIIEALKRNPKSVKIGVATVPSDDQFNILQPLKLAGVDPSKVTITTFSGGGDLLSNLLGGRVDVVSTGVGELSGLQGTKVRIVSTSAPERQAGDLEGVPTWKELGVDFQLDHWRGVFGPANMPEEARAWWEHTLEEMSKTQTWKDRLKKDAWTPAFEDSQTFSTTVSTQEKSAAQIVKDLGLGG